jgi:lysophospholipase L1-like esterase
VDALSDKDLDPAGVAERAYPREAADPYCLRSGEAETILAGHPWRRFAALGDSIAEGVGDPIPGYRTLPFVDRVAAELARVRPDLAYLNLGSRGLRVHEVRARQIRPALDFEPDLALVACGANDALRPGYEARAEGVDRDLAAVVTALQEHGVLVVTVSIFVRPAYPSLPEWLRPSGTERMTMLGDRTTALAAELGTVHIDLAGHPIAGSTGSISADGLHGNGRAQAVAAAETIRALGAVLRSPSPGTVRFPHRHEEP